MKPILVMSSVKSLAPILTLMLMQSFFTFGLDRDLSWFNESFLPPIHFPSVANPYAVQCYPRGLQGQSTPVQFSTGCPSNRLPEYGVSYGNNPYPLFNITH